MGKKELWMEVFKVLVIVTHVTVFVVTLVLIWRIKR
jgi:hypothetical protein